MSVEVACVNRSERVAITEDGQSLPITNLFDSYGEECDNVDEAVTAVAGPDKNGMWLCIDFSVMEKVTLQ